VHQAVAGSVGQEMFTERHVQLQEWNGEANVPEHWSICWRKEKQNNYLCWVLDPSSIILYREVQSGYITLISWPLVVISAHAMRVSWLWVTCLEINRRSYKQANAALMAYVEIPWEVKDGTLWREMEERCGNITMVTERT